MTSSPECTELVRFPVQISESVIWNDLDAFGHVNNIVHLRYFESVRIEYFRRIEFFSTMGDAPLGPIVASNEVRYRRPLNFPDQIRIGARVSDIAHDRFSMQFAIYSQAHAGIAATGGTVIVCYDYRGRHKAPLPADVRSRIEALEQNTPL